MNEDLIKQLAADYFQWKSRLPAYYPDSFEDYLAEQLNSTKPAEQRWQDSEGQK